MGYLFGIIIFVLDVWAIASVINSNAERTNKIIWVLLIAVLPVIGLIAWWFAGPKANYNRG
ncbi:MAG: PLD nuclease N-terminal domain-containing protein [Paracoccus sp. (in: a-proteobacteria)]|uniref:PLD nuclease N-terminal domain-containing protein n=1 Tax=Paracoccus sp. TaxID=267 RepID=UPI0026DF10F2|nr:PLD nuclease N-terminal domain-containing protein [Paracoccus sp. (in: a-proteobacteria)]MDO5614243.1 PLD nuclease N-terminal domain-containing protein [Paracoccus sp. (in: a-proteobacteria)]